MLQTVDSDAGLGEALGAYLRRWPEESDQVALFAELWRAGRQGPDPYARARLEGHFTASSWLLDSARSRVLLTHHRKLDRWLQLGGHADGERDLRAVALKEASTAEFRQYAHQVVANAKALASELMERGLGLVSGGTDNHLILMDVTPRGINGKPAARALNKAGIECNYNTVPFDPRKPMDPSGLRIGTPSRAMKSMQLTPTSSSSPDARAASPRRVSRWRPTASRSATRSRSGRGRPRQWATTARRSASAMTKSTRRPRAWATTGAELIRGIDTRRVMGCIDFTESQGSGRQ